MNIILFSRIVKRERKKRNMTQASLSKTLNLTASTMSRLERAETEVGWIYALKLCEYFKIDLTTALIEEKKILKEELEKSLECLD